VRSAWRSVAALMVVAVMSFWIVQWQSAPAPGTTAGASASTEHDRDDD
jgi:hypothetical protein